MTLAERIQTEPRSALVARLAALTDADAVIEGASATPYYTDIYRSGVAPLAVLRPASVEALQAVVRGASAAGVAIYPRGGGASYSDGYLPTRADSLIVDTGRLNRIVEINATDAYVTVEAGVTWAELKAALDPLGLRTPFFGPFSGLAATIGGSVSQNSLSHGSGTHGISAQSVLALDIVTASGDLLRTGSSARGAPPFARHYGPDLTGLFTGDCGALGIKARITLPLLKRKAAVQCASFVFDSFADLAHTMQQAALERLDDEHFGIDAALAQGQIARQDTLAILGMARAVLSSSSNIIVGLSQLLRMAIAGSRAMASAQFVLHVIFDGVDNAEAKAKLARFRVLAKSGREIPNTVPTIVHSMPFAPLFNTLGPKGERWVPVHGILAHTKVNEFHDALQALYAARVDDMRRLDVWTGAMFETVGSSGFLYEVAFYWPGAQTAYHHAAIPSEYLASLSVYPDNDEVTAFVARLKQDVIDLLCAFDAVHFQLGRAYPYAQTIAPRNLALLKALKAELDPQELMNPGVLGL